MNREEVTTKPTQPAAKAIPAVSIYTICYNQAGYIRECLDGIVAQQTDFPFEAIIIDDASQDATPEIIKEYAAQYPDIIRPILLTENWHSQRKSKYRDIFLKEARGEYFAWCDGDDFWCDTLKLQRQKDFMDKNPGIAACSHILEIRNESSFNIESHISSATGQLTAEDVFLNGAAQPSTLMFRKRFINSIEPLFNKAFDIVYPNVDALLQAAALTSGGIFCLPWKMSVYRKNDNGISTKQIHSGEKEINLARLFNKYSKDFTGKTGCRIHCICLMGESSRLIAKGEFISGLKYKFKAFAMAPFFIISMYLKKYLKRRNS